MTALTKQRIWYRERNSYCIPGCGQMAPACLCLLCCIKYPRPEWKKQQRWTLSLAGDLTVNNSLQRLQTIKMKKKTWNSIWPGGGQSRACHGLHVSEGEIPVVDRLCSGDVDDVVKHNLGWQPEQDSHLFALVSRSPMRVFSFILPPLPLTPPLHPPNHPPFPFYPALSHCPIFRL